MFAFQIRATCYDIPHTLKHNQTTFTPDLKQKDVYLQNIFRISGKVEIREVFKNNPAYAETLIAENDKMKALISYSKDNKESILNELPKNISGKDV